MSFDRKDTSNAGGVSYNRENYECKRDGTWVSVETPQDQKEK